MYVKLHSNIMSANENASYLKENTCFVTVFFSLFRKVLYVLFHASWGFFGRKISVNEDFLKFGLICFLLCLKHNNEGICVY